MKISYGHKKNVQKKQKTLADVRNERARAEKAAQKAKNKPIPVGQHQETATITPEAAAPQPVDAEVQAQRLEAQKARRKAQKAAKEARKNSRFGGKTIFDKKTGAYIAKPVEEVKAESIAKHAKGSKFNFSGLGKYAKKGGKIGLAIGVAAGLAALAKWGYDKLFGSDDSKEETTPEVKTQTPTEKKTPKTTTPTQTAPKTKAEDKAPAEKKSEDKKTETDKSAEKPKSEKTKKQSPAPKTVVPTPAPKADDADKAEEPEKTEKAEEKVKTDKAPEAEKQETENDVHSVKRGDNVWNIAKKHLKDLNNGDKPTNAEILKHTKEIMEWNNLEFEADGKRVIIKPGDQLKLTA